MSVGVSKTTKLSLGREGSNPSSHKYVLNNYCVLGTGLGTGIQQCIGLIGS